MEAYLLGIMVRLNKEFIQEIENINEEYKKNDVLREEIIKESRDILKASKKAIYSVHRDDIEGSKNLLTTAKNKIVVVWSLIKKSDFESVGSFRASLEEYVEAKCFLEYVINKTLPTKKELAEELGEGFDFADQTYIGGISDFSGELVRKAVLLATKKDTDSVREIFELVGELYGLLMEFDFRTGDLRKKFDSIKYNLAKLESIIYDLSLRS